MKSVQLRRGDRTVTLEKLPDRFAVRLRQGRAASTSSLAAACGSPRSPVEHVESVGPQRMDVFSVQAESNLEEVMDDLRKAGSAEVVTHMYSIDKSRGGQVIPTGEMTVQFQPSAAQEECEELLRQEGLEIVRELDYLPRGFVVRLSAASTRNPLKVAEALQAKSELVAVAEPDLAFQRSLQFVPSSPVYRDQWHLENRGDATGLKAGADVSAEAAWDVTLGDRSVTVCVIDDGFDLDHPDFDLPGKIVAPRDFGQDDDRPEPVSASDNHGTSCAGVAVAEGLSHGSVGLAPRCALMPVRMGMWLSDDAVESLFQHAIDGGADVISCSWSASAWDFALSTRMHGIIHKAATQGRDNGKGCVILFAAGNEARPLDDPNWSPPSHQGFALHPDVIAVGASNSLDLRSSYSNFGPELTLCAPSSGSPGRSVTTTDRLGSAGYSTGDFTSSFGGTSSATPLAAGLAALILSESPDLSSAEVRSILVETADEIDPAGGDYTGGHSDLYGHGRINAQRAVEMASGTGGPDVPQVARTLSMDHRLNRKIPDLATVETAIPFPLAVDVAVLEVRVDVQHTWSGDLTLTLKAPNGSEVVLQDRTGGGTDDVVRTLRSSDDAILEPLIGTPAQGEWDLSVVDHQPQDEGVLRKWGISVTY